MYIEHPEFIFPLSGTLTLRGRLIRMQYHKKSSGFFNPFFNIIRAPQKVLAKFPPPQKKKKIPESTISNPKKVCHHPCQHFNSRVLPREHLLSWDGEFVWCPVMLTRLSDKINCPHGTNRSRVPLLNVGKTSDALLWNCHIKTLFFQVISFIMSKTEQFYHRRSLESSLIWKWSSKVCVFYLHWYSDLLFIGFQWSGVQRCFEERCHALQVWCLFVRYCGESKCLLR